MTWELEDGSADKAPTHQESVRSKDGIPSTWVKSKAGVVLEAEIREDNEASWPARLAESVSSVFNSQVLPQSIKEEGIKKDI